MHYGNFFTTHFSLDDMNIGARVIGGGNQTQWKTYSLQRGTAPPVGTEVSPPQIPVNPGVQPGSQNPIYASSTFENADGTLVIRRQMLNR